MYQRCLRQQLAQLLPQAMKNAAFGDADCAGAHAQFLGHVFGGFSIDHCAPECLNCVFLKILADDFDSTEKEFALDLLIFGFTTDRLGGYLRKTALRIRATGSLGAVLL